MNLQKNTLKEAKKMIDKNYEYFISHFDELYSEYPEKYIVIKNENVIGSYDSFDEAFDKTTQTEIIGSFLIQLCSSNNERNINHFYSNNVVFA